MMNQLYGNACKAIAGINLFAPRGKLRPIAIVCFVGAFNALNVHANDEEIRFDASKIAGTIRALHGVNNGPLNQGGIVDVSKDYKALSIPLARLHDSEWPRPDIVDLHAIFPNLAAAAEDPANYRFSKTDDYIQAIVATGTGIVYRLGESIEHTKKKYHVMPPGDYEQWARACIGIIRHYNAGWAGGFQDNIRYWEIWNEPENQPAMWTGTDEQYYSLYAVVSKAIKAQFPELKVGGPALGYQGDLAGDTLRPSKFLNGFLTNCRANKLPLDFFSWHTYSDDPFAYSKKARAIRKLLDEFGFTDTEIHLNEWNYLPDNNWQPISLEGQGDAREKFYERVGGAEGAAFVVSVLLDLQESPLAMANFYSGDSSLFGLFNHFGGRRKNYFGVKAFRMLMDTPRRLALTQAPLSQIAVCAGIDAQSGQINILLSNFKSSDNSVALTVDNLPWQGNTTWQSLRIDAGHSLTPGEHGDATGHTVRLSLKMSAPSVLLLTLCERKSK